MVVVVTMNAVDIVAFNATLAVKKYDPEKVSAQ